MRCWLWVCPGLFAALLAGCSRDRVSASRGPYDAQLNDLASKAPALIVDSCIVRHTADGVFIARRESREIALLARDEVVQYLTSQGIVLGRRDIPFTCGFVGERVPLSAGDDAESTPAPVELPLVLRDDLVKSPELMESYLHLFRLLNGSRATARVRGKQRPQSEPLILSDGDRDRLVADLGTSNVIIVRTAAQNVSGGYVAKEVMPRLAVELLFAAVFVAATGSAGTGVITGPLFKDLPGTVYETMVVDLKQRVLVWKKHETASGTRGAKPHSYRPGWAEDRFHPFIPEGMSVAQRA